MPNFEKVQSQAIALVMTRFAFTRSVLLGKYRIGMAANTNFVHQLVFAKQELHNQMSISWLVLN